MKNEQLTINKGKAFLFLVAAFCVICVIATCKNPESEADAGSQYDPDLNGWRSASWSPFFMGDRIIGFAYGNGRYVAISKKSATGKIAWSKDGDIWKKAQLPQESSDAAFNAVCYGETGSGGMFVAVGDSGMYTWSRDGEKWNEPVEMKDFNTNDINGIAFGAGFFVAVGGSGIISYSADGISWAQSDAPAPFAGVVLNDIAYDAYTGAFYVVGDGGQKAWANNPSGSSPWKYRGPDYPLGYTANITKVTVGRYGDKIGIGMLYYYTDSSPAKRFAVAINPDFVFNDKKDDCKYLDMHIEQFLFGDLTMNGIAWGGGNFFVAGSGAMIGYWPSAEPSREGERFFRAISFPDFKRWEISALEACNGRFFVGNVDGKIGYSK
jgi:hypothetical protein